MSLWCGLATLLALNAGILGGLLLPDILRLWRDPDQIDANPDEEDKR